MRASPIPYGSQSRPSWITARGADYIALTGIIFDGSGKTLPQNSGLVQLAAGRGILVRDCEFVGSGANGVASGPASGCFRRTTRFSGA